MGGHAASECVCKLAFSPTSFSLIPVYPFVYLSSSFRLIWHQESGGKGEQTLSCFLLIPQQEFPRTHTRLTKQSLVFVLLTGLFSLFVFASPTAPALSLSLFLSWHFLLSLNSPLLLHYLENHSFSKSLRLPLPVSCVPAFPAIL